MQFHTTPRRNGVWKIGLQARKWHTTTVPQKSSESSDETHNHRHDRPTDMPMVVSFFCCISGQILRKISPVRRLLFHPMESFKMFSCQARNVPSWKRLIPAKLSNTLSGCPGTWLPMTGTMPTIMPPSRNGWPRTARAGARKTTPTTITRENVYESDFYENSWCRWSC